MPGDRELEPETEAKHKGRQGRFSKLLFLPPVLLGIAILIFVLRSGGLPDRAIPQEQAHPVRVIEVPSVDLVPRTLGYGYVQPGRVWEAVAEVGGRIVDKHERLESGELMAAGTTILRIDPTDYQLAVESTEARIRGAEAELAELEVRQSNAESALEIERRNLELAERDLQRKTTLLSRGSISQAAVDEAERAVLTGRQAVQGHESTLALIPAEREVLRSNLSLFQAELEQARRDLERTEIVIPFDGRVAAVNVERLQFAAAGQVLAVIDGVDTAEVAAQIPLNRMRHLVEAADVSGVDLIPQTAGSIFEQLGLDAVVRLTSGDFRVEWPARFARIRETIDPRTRTVGVVVAVDEPYRMARAGERPPLAKNMYVEVELRGKVQRSSLVVPRSAIHDGVVYVVGADERLERRPVSIGLEQGDLAVIAGGLEAGEKIVVSDLVPAIGGMLLDPTPDQELYESLVALATGSGPLR